MEKKRSLRPIVSLCVALLLLLTPVYSRAEEDKSIKDSDFSAYLPLVDSKAFNSLSDLLVDDGELTQADFQLSCSDIPPNGNLTPSISDVFASEERNTETSGFCGDSALWPLQERHFT